MIVRTKRQGAKSAADIFLAVGFALTIWESAEDVTAALFHELVGHSNSKLAQDFMKAGSRRSDRKRMLKRAFDEYGSKLPAPQLSVVLVALGALDALSGTRNQIGHGHCSEWNESVNGELITSGFFLRSALTPDGEFMEPDFDESGQLLRPAKYMMDDLQIAEFSAQVRKHRGALMDAFYTLLSQRLMSV